MHNCSLIYSTSQLINSHSWVPTSRTNSKQKEKMPHPHPPPGGEARLKSDDYSLWLQVFLGMTGVFKCFLVPFRLNPNTRNIWQRTLTFVCLPDFSLTSSLLCEVVPGLWGEGEKIKVFHHKNLWSTRKQLKWSRVAVANATWDEVNSINRIWRHVLYQQRTKRRTW